MRPIIYFVRHGETDWNAERRFQGQADTAINARGRSQADRNGRRLSQLLDDPAAFDFVASPLARTRETMERLRAALSLEPAGYRTDPRLMELHFGDWQGRTDADMAKAAPGAVAARDEDKWRFRPSGAMSESYAMLAERVRPWFDAVERPTVCVTHGGVIRAVLFLSGNLEPAEAAAIDIPQDRILVLTGTGRAWE